MNLTSQPHEYGDGRPGRIGPYTIVDLLGRGGMGTVYKGVRQSGEPRVVALKVLHGIYCDQPAQRLLHEIHTMTLLDHPHVVRAFDADHDDHGRPYFTMEFVDGLPITRYCTRHHASPSQRLALFLQVCDGMIHVHEKGVIHGDLKPGNILVVEHHHQPHAKIIDFGFARLLYEELDSHRSYPLAPPGSPAYLSPESADPGPRRLDPRTDVYALGAVLFELITDSPVMDPHRFQGADLSEALRLIRQAERPRLSQRLARSSSHGPFDGLNSGELAALDHITARALAVNPEARYADVHLLKRDLERFIAERLMQHVG